MSLTPSAVDFVAKVETLPPQVSPVVSLLAAHLTGCYFKFSTVENLRFFRGDVVVPFTVASWYLIDPNVRRI